MKALKEKILAIKEAVQQSLREATNDDSLETIRITYLGRNGHIANLTATLKTMALEEKRLCGPLLSDLKIFAENTYKERKQELIHMRLCQEKEKKKNFDITIYKINQAPGRLHIYTHLIKEIEDIFTSMGYQRGDGPELESEYYNFDALNVPEHHPARDMQDTIWISGMPGMLLRTQTSPVQVRALQAQGAPLALFVPGRTFRHEATDATHDYLFSQLEGLFVDKDISITHLLATVKAFLSRIFAMKSIELRVRVGFFPFVEPGLEIDFSCPFCTTGCTICKKSGFIELMGAGLVHPHVLRAGGIDPECYSGFAFGMGLERLAMIKYGISDIRLFHSNKVSFLDQF